MGFTNKLLDADVGQNLKMLAGPCAWSLGWDQRWELLAERAPVSSLTGSRNQYRRSALHGERPDKPAVPAEQQQRCRGR